MIWQWLAAVKPAKIMAWPFEERPQRNWISVLEEFLKSLSLQDSFQRVFGDIKKGGGVARGSGFIKCNRRMHLSPTYTYCSFKAFLQASCLAISKIKSVKNPLLTDVGHFKVLFFQTSREARDGRPGFSKAVFKSNFSSLIYLQKGLVSLMWK